MSSLEQTLSIIKPDAVERNLIEEIKKIFINNKLEIKDSKKLQITKEEAAEFYKVHQSKPFYNVVFLFILRSNSCYDTRRKNAVALNRKLMGSTDPKNTEENTIRKLYGISIDKNSVMDLTHLKILRMK